MIISPDSRPLSPLSAGIRPPCRGNFQNSWDDPSAVYACIYGGTYSSQNLRRWFCTPRFCRSSPANVEALLIVGRIESGRGITDSNRAVSINLSGEFAGYAMGKASSRSSGSGGWKAYRYTDGVGMVKLSATDSTASGINDDGDVIYQNDWTPDAFLLLEAEGKTVNLLTAGAVLGNATEVAKFQSKSPSLEFLNNSRMISGFFDDTTARFVFILTPVP